MLVKLIRRFSYSSGYIYDFNLSPCVSQFFHYFFIHIIRLYRKFKLKNFFDIYDYHLMIMSYLTNKNCLSCYLFRIIIVRDHCLGRFLYIIIERYGLKNENVFNKGMVANVLIQAPYVIISLNIS